MPREINPWAMYPRKTSTASLPASLKMEVTTKVNELIETGRRFEMIPTLHLYNTEGS
jgi:hypothetical protein